MSIRLHVIGPGREVICGFSASLSLSRSLRSSPTTYALHRDVVSVAAVSALQNHMLPPEFVGAQHQYRLRNADTPSSKRRSFSDPAAAALRPCPVLDAPTLGAAATTPLPRSATDVDALRWRPPPSLPSIPTRCRVMSLEKSSPALSAARTRCCARSICARSCSP